MSLATTRTCTCIVTVLMGIGQKLASRLELITIGRSSNMFLVSHIGDVWLLQTTIVICGLRHMMTRLVPSTTMSIGLLKRMGSMLETLTLFQRKIPSYMDGIIGQPEYNNNVLCLFL
ncbi:hypothetical protein LINPERPRIM_LOCUS26873 [Linum perenne]